MKEFVLVEFLSLIADKLLLLGKLEELGNDFELIKSDYEWDVANDLTPDYEWVRISGRINYSCATIIKLRDPFLAERMRISYIPEDLKNKYRT